MSLPTAPEPHAPPDLPARLDRAAAGLASVWPAQRGTADLMVAAGVEIRRLRGDLATAEAKVARSSHRFGLEAGAWEEVATRLEAIRRPPLDVVIRVAECRAHAAGLEEFVRSLSAEPGEASPESEQEHARRTAG